MPKLTAFALERICEVTSSRGTEKTFEAVEAWISLPLLKEFIERFPAEKVKKEYVEYQLEAGIEME